MQLIVTLAPEVIQHGTLLSPAGAGRVSMVDARDIASVAANTLLESGHERKAYEITGLEALSFGDVAHRLTVATGHPIGVVDVPPDVALAHLVATGLPTWWAEYRVGVYRLYREAGARGWAASMTNVVAEVGRQRPRTFAELASEFRAAFVD